jgi:hypothetical protein
MQQSDRQKVHIFRVLQRNATPSPNEGITSISNMETEQIHCERVHHSQLQHSSPSHKLPEVHCPVVKQQR